MNPPEHSQYQESGSSINARDGYAIGIVKQNNHAHRSASYRLIYKACAEECRNGPESSEIPSSFGTAAVALHPGQISETLRQGGGITCHKLSVKPFDHLQCLLFTSGDHIFFPGPRVPDIGVFH